MSWLVAPLPQRHVSIVDASPIAQATTAVEVPLKLRTRLPPEQISVSRVPGQPTLYTIALSGGASLQTYVDPGEVGLPQFRELAPALLGL